MNPADPARMVVRAMRSADWPAVAAVYAAGIATGDATFETEVPSWERWHTARLPDHRLVAVDGERLLGWAVVSATSSRPVYAGVVENSIFLAEHARGHGVGRALLTALLESTERAGIWTVQAGIFPENVASLALHRACGFRDVGVRERLGQLHGRWRDVVLLERRSPVV